uniref:Uncharacterized protein n=1 Tax=Rhizophora mucronata TaxID=61149 RepID=A0A2P2P965_RHIMU
MGNLCFSLGAKLCVIRVMFVDPRFLFITR